MNNKGAVIILGIICFVLTVAICIQIKTVSDTSTKVGKTLEENELRDNVLKWKEKYDLLYEKLEIQFLIQMKNLIIRLKI